MSKKRASPGDDELKPVELSEAHARLLDQLDDEYERLTLADQFATLYKLAPFYQKRNERLKAIDGFWFRALQNLTGFLSLYGTHAEDLEALKYLENVWVERFQPDPRAFRVEMHFKENPFFTNAVLSKTYALKAPPSGELIDGVYESMLRFNPDKDISISSSKISWRNDKVNLCKKFPAPKALSGEQDELMDSGSFFNFFELDDDESDLGLQLAGELFSNPIPYFKGEIDDDEDFEDDEDDDESIDEDSDADEIDLERPAKRPKRG